MPLVDLSSDPLVSWTLTAISMNGWKACVLGMEAGAFCPFQLSGQEIMLYRNVLKLRKETKLAEERGESSVTEKVLAHEQRGFWSGHHIDDILSENHAMPPGRKAHADQDGWREVGPRLIPSLPC